MGSDGTGVITKVTANICEVSSDIDGSNHILMVNRNIFYAFGIRCEGHLTNLLDRGTEINICYTTEHECKPVVTIAWLGEKPKRDQLKPVMEDVYGQSGRVCHVVDVGYFIHSDKLPYRVKISKEVVYRDGCPNEDDLVVGNDVLFDAIPVAMDCDSEYQATCAWIGKEPRLVDRFGLRISESLDVLEDLSETFYGTVVVIPNAVVAFVKVEMKEFNESVILFRSSFERECERIQDIVLVGDSLCLHLSYGCIFRECRQWFAVKAWKNNSDQNVSEENSKENGETFTKTDVEVPVSFDLPTLCTAEENALYETQTLSKKNMVLYSDPPLKCCISEFIASAQTAVAKYEPNQSSIFIARNTFFVNGMPCKDQDDFVQYKRTVVSFEGVSKMPRDPEELEEFDEKEGTSQYLATCAWIGEKPSLTFIYESIKLPVAESLLQNSNVTFYGTVVQFYFPHKAVILVGLMNQIACLHVTSFHSEKSLSSEDCLITDFVQLGDHLGFKLVEDNECEIPACAVDVVVLTSDEYRKRFAEALSLNPELYKIIDNWSCQSDSKDESHIVGQASFRNPELGLRDSEPRYDAGSKVLFSEPPLKGVISGLLSVRRRSAVITYNNSFSVSVGMSRFYIFGVRCQNFDDFAVLAQLGRIIVNFEGIVAEQEDREEKNPTRYFVTCAWIGEKPSLGSVFQYCQNENLKDLVPLFSKYYVTFYGMVKIFFLPDKALVKLDNSLLNQYACLHLSSFLIENNVQPKNHFITDFFKLGDCLSFKLVRNSLCDLSLHVVNAKVITQEELKTGCAREKVRNPDLFKIISSTVPNQSFFSESFLCSHNEKVLYSHPPLCGSVKFTNSKKAVISYEGIEIDLDLFNLFAGQWSCYMTKKRKEVKDAETVYFEAVPRSSVFSAARQRPYYAALAWVDDQKPALDAVAKVAQALGPPKPSNEMPMIVMRRNDRTYVGSVFSIYLPDDALILLVISGERMIVRLNKGEFERGPQPATASSFITDYVHLVEIVRFKIRRDAQYCGGLCAYDIEKATLNDLLAFKDDSKDWTMKLVDEPLLEQTLGAFDVTITQNNVYRRRLVQIVANKPHLFSNIIGTGYRSQVKMRTTPMEYADDNTDDCDFTCCKDKKVLFANPPLAGRVIWCSSERALIGYEGIKVDVPYCSVPTHKEALFKNKAIGSANAKLVHFEAIPRSVSKVGLNPYYATLAWIGKKKPCLLTISRCIGGEPILIWRFTDRTFVGKVIRFSLPNDALIQTEIRGNFTVACLHKSVFLSSLKPEKPYITDYVCFREYVEFKVRRDQKCRVGVCASSIEKSTAEAYLAFCENSKHWTV